MNPKGKKFVSLLLAFSLMLLPVSLHADRREGATLLITKKDGQRIQGELIAVKKDSLLILTWWAEWDESINIADIENVRVVRKSEATLYSITGILVGGTIGAVYGVKKVLGGIEDVSCVYGGVIYGAIFAMVGGLVGLGIGSAAGIDEIIQIEGLSELGLEETLKHLRKKARIRDYEYYPRTEQKIEKKEEKVEAAELKIKVKVEEAIIRLRPLTESEVVAKVPLGTVFAPEKKVGKWYQVSFRDKRGFVLSGYIHESESDVLKKMKKTTEIQRTLDKLRKKARIRDYK